MASTCAVTPSTMSSTLSSDCQRARYSASEWKACSSVIGGWVRIIQWCFSHDAFQFGVRGAVRPGKVSLYHGAGRVIGQPAPSWMCGALTAM